MVALLSDLSGQMVQYLLPFAGGFIFLYFLLPRSARTRLKTKFQKSGVLVTLCTSDGFERDEHMQIDMKYGLFTKGDETYIFTPEPKFMDEVGKPKVDIKDDFKRNIDEAITHRSLTDTGKAHYTGLIGKGIAVTPKLLALIKKVNRKGTLNMNPGVKEENIHQIELVEAGILRTYLPNTFSQSALENMRFSAERRGFLGRPVEDTLKKNLPSIVFILLIVIGGYMIVSGKLDLGRIFGKYMGGSP